MKLRGGLPKNNLNLSLTSQLESLVNLYNEYSLQKVKFEGTVLDINSGKEYFYPSESKILFIQYIETIDILLGFIKDGKLNIIGAIQAENISQELTNKLNDLLVDIVSNIPLPEQTEEEIGSLYEPEDYMSDAVYGMDMFSEKSST